MSKVWFITGATRGLGAELAKAALAAGDRVVATGRNIEAVIGKLGRADNLLPLRLDVVHEAEAVSAAKAAVDHFGRIDVLVNNAGFGLFGAMEEVSDAEVRKQFDTNFFGLMNVTRSVLPAFRAQGRGHIINISSTSGVSGFPGSSSYCASKFAVEGASECLRLELRPLGIFVTIVQPGGFRTNFLDASSVVIAERTIDSYPENSAAIRSGIGEANGKQDGDPAKLARALLALADQETPPMRFVAGDDAFELIDFTLQRRVSELEEARAAASSLSFVS